MHKSKGYSLLEVLLTLLISTLVFGAFFSALVSFQSWTRSLNLLMERDANLWATPLLLPRWILAAGNNRWKESWEGIRIEPGLAEIKTDIDGPNSFPDSELSSSFEILALKSSRSNLQVKSGSGSFQPVIKNVTDLRLKMEAPAILSLHLTAATEAPLVISKDPSSEEIGLVFFLRNYRSNLFPEAW